MKVWSGAALAEPLAGQQPELDNAAGAIALATAIEPRLPVGLPWLALPVTHASMVDGQSIAWANNIVRGDNIVWGNLFLSGAFAQTLSVLTTQ